MLFRSPRPSPDEKTPPHRPRCQRQQVSACSRRACAPPGPPSHPDEVDAGFPRLADDLLSRVAPPPARASPPSRGVQPERHKLSPSVLPLRLCSAWFLGASSHPWSLPLSRVNREQLTQHEVLHRQVPTRPRIGRGNKLIRSLTRGRMTELLPIELHPLPCIHHGSADEVLPPQERALSLRLGIIESPRVRPLTFSCAVEWP